MTFKSGLPALLLMSCGLNFPLRAVGEAATNEFSFDEYLVAGVRVHLLAAKDSPDIQTTLTERDIDRIVEKVNRVWAQAGIHFYVESLVHEEATRQETNARPRNVTRSDLLELRPEASKAASMFHLYYLKNMPVNGIYFPDAIFVKDTASLQRVEGGIDEPLPRVTSHELGHAFGLPHRQDRTNLMASGTTGTWLNETEIHEARETARAMSGVEPASSLLNKAEALLRANNKSDAANLFSRLATIPRKAPQVEPAKQHSQGP